jgi:hypothetical protein
MVVLCDPYAWGDVPPPWAKLPDHTLVIVIDPTRGGAGPGGIVRCYLAGRVYGGKVEDWKAV